MLGFDNWLPLNRLAISDLPRYGDIASVYAIRSKGTGELLYIGSTDNLRRRIFGNYLGGVGGETTKRINGLLFSERKIAEVELAWMETEAHREKERELKNAYRRESGRLPRWTKI